MPSSAVPSRIEQAALASVNGTLPPDQMLMHGSGNMATGSDSDAVYVLERTSVVAGNDFRVGRSQF